MPGERERGAESERETDRETKRETQIDSDLKRQRIRQWELSPVFKLL